MVENIILVQGFLFNLTLTLHHLCLLNFYEAKNQHETLTINISNYFN